MSGIFFTREIHTPYYSGRMKPPMLHRDLEQIRQAENKALASIVQTQSEVETMIARSWVEIGLVFPMGKPAVHTESLAVLPGGYTIIMKRFLDGRRD